MIETIKLEKKAWTNVGRIGKLPLFGDDDKDGVINIFDCAPSNYNQQGWLHDYLERRQERREMRQEAKAIGEQRAKEEAKEVLAKQYKERELQRYGKKQAAPRPVYVYPPRYRYKKSKLHQYTIRRDTLFSSADVKEKTQTLQNLFGGTGEGLNMMSKLSIGTSGEGMALMSGAKKDKNLLNKI